MDKLEPGYIYEDETSGFVHYNQGSDLEAISLFLELEQMQPVSTVLYKNELPLCNSPSLQGLVVTAAEIYHTVKRMRSVTNDKLDKADTSNVKREIEHAYKMFLILSENLEPEHDEEIAARLILMLLKDVSERLAFIGKNSHLTAQRISMSASAYKVPRRPILTIFETTEA